MENQNQIPIIEKQSRSKLKLAMGIFGFLIFIQILYGVDPPIFLIAFLFLVAFLSIIDLVKNLIKKKIDIISILMLLGLIGIFSEFFPLQIIGIYAGFYFVFTASLLSLLEFFSPNLIKRKSILIISLFLVLFLGISYFSIGHTISMRSEGIKIALIERKWIPIQEYIPRYKPAKIILWQDGEKRAEYQREKWKGVWEGEDAKVESRILPILHKLNTQLKCVFNQEDIQKIKNKNKIAELIFEDPTDIIISQKIKWKERGRISTNEKGYRILENVETAIFVLEDNLGQGLDSYVLIGQNVKGKIIYDCWAIDSNKKEEIYIKIPFLFEDKTKDKIEIDKTWIDELNSVFDQNKLLKKETEKFKIDNKITDLSSYGKLENLSEYKIWL